MPNTAIANPIRAAGLFGLYLTCLVVSTAVVLNAASGLLRDSAPEIALLINPLDSETRLSIAGMEFADDAQSDKNGVTEIVKTGLLLSPIDGRYFSILGLIEHDAGDLDTARQLYGRALELLPTEIQALVQTLRLDLGEGNSVAAAGIVERVARRWPERWNEMEPLLPALLSDHGSREIISQTFAADIQLQRLLIGSLAKSPELLPAAHGLLARWHQEGRPELDGFINMITGSLIRAQRYSEAFLLFASTRDSISDTGDGFVYNGAFDKPISGNPFDWTLRPQAGVTFAVVDTPPFASAQGEPSSPALRGKSLAVGFLDNPVRFENVTVTVRLLPGRHQLNARYNARDLRAPKPLNIAVSCLGSRGRLGEAELRSGEPGELDVAVDFTVPDSGCGLQRVFLFNDNMTDSWKNRYSGTFYLNQVGIQRVFE